MSVEAAPIAADALNRIALAADQLARLEPRLAEARRELHAAIVEAHSHGVSAAAIARVAGVSRQAVYKIIERAK